MKKKITLICGMILTASLLGGCGVELPDLTEEQNALMTEYAANLILKHSPEVKRNLLNDDELEVQLKIEAENRVKEEKRKQLAEEYKKALENGNKATSENEDVDSETDIDSDSAEAGPVTTIPNLGEFFGLNDFSVVYKEYQLMQSYPDDSEDYFFAMDATAGKQLCVVKFSVENISAGEADFNMLEKKGRFILTINGDIKTQVQSTLLLDDLAAYKGVIAPATSQDMVLIFEIDDSVSSIESMILDVKCADESGTIVLQ